MEVGRRLLANENGEQLKKGDVIIYPYAFFIQEAKIIKVFSDKYVKVRNKGKLFHYNILPISDILGVQNKQ